MITNTIIGVLLGFLLFTIGELIGSIIFKKKFPEKKLNETLMNEKKLVNKQRILL